MFGSFLNFLFNSYILLSISVFVVLLGAIYFYINYQIEHQNNKLESLVQVMRGVINDVHFIKSKLFNMNSDAELHKEDMQQDGGDGGDGDKIVVSDNDEYYDDDESVGIYVCNNNLRNVNISKESDIDESDNEESDIDESDIDESDIDESDIALSDCDIKVIELVEPIVSLVKEEKIDIKVEDVEEESIKVKVEDVEEESIKVKAETVEPELGKMSIGALRALVKEKELCAEPLKLKKYELLNLLNNKRTLDI